MRVLFSTFALALISVSVSAQNAKLKLPPSNVAPQTPLDQRERAVQLLDRFTFGARPGDVDHVLAMGADQWFEQQLNPDAIKDAALEIITFKSPEHNSESARVQFVPVSP